MHYGRWRSRGDVLWQPLTATERFWSKVDRKGPDDCWLWTAFINADGYGRSAVIRADGRRGTTAAHRIAYELSVGPIPEGMELDHLCRNRSCVNPAHLEPVTGRENKLRSPEHFTAIAARKTHCVNGHAFEGENLFFHHGGRACRACYRESSRRSRERTRNAQS